jgi:hypothetical protein
MYEIHSRETLGKTIKHLREKYHVEPFIIARIAVMTQRELEHLETDASPYTRLTSTFENMIDLAMLLHCVLSLENSTDNPDGWPLETTVEELLEADVQIVFFEA